MDHHLVAIVSITGTCLDVLGSLYLAYDLLGGQHGPLRLLTRAVTYSVVFGIGYGLGLGLFFGLASGIATGITLSIEFSRAARGLHRHRRRSHNQSLHRILCRQSPGAAAWGIRHWTHPLRFCPAIHSILAITV